MNGSGHRFLTTSALIGMMALGGWGGAALTASPAVAATGTPRAPRASRKASAKSPGGGGASAAAACTMTGALEGSQATRVTHHNSVLVGLPGYNPNRTASDTTNSNQRSALGGLLPAMTTYGYPSWTALGSARKTPGAIAPVMKGSIEGSQATIVVHHNSVLVGLPGYNPNRTASDTTNSNQRSALGGLFPAMTTYGYPSWTAGSPPSPAACTPAG